MVGKSVLERRRRQSPAVAARQAERREACVAAGQELVDRHGLGGLTASSLAVALGVTPAALYRIFLSLDALRAELVARALDRLGSLMDHRAGAAAPLVRLQQLVRAFLELREVDRGAFLLIDQALSAPEPVFPADEAALVEAHVGAVLARVEAALADATRAGALSAGDTRRRTLALVGLVHGVTHLAKRDRLEPKRSHHGTAVLDDALDAVLRGWARQR